MSTNLLQPLKIVAELGVDAVGKNLRVLAIDDVFLPVQKPCWNLELRGVLNDSDNALQLVRVQFSSPVETVNSRTQKFNGLSTHRLLRSTSAFLHTKLE